MGIITPNAKKDLGAEQKRAVIMSCLQDTRCPMTPDQIREWLRDRRWGTFTEAAILAQLHILEKAGRVCHPTPEQTAAWTYVRGVGR